MNTKPIIRCVIIEDEPLAQSLLIDHIDRIPSLELIGSANNGKTALKLCEELEPDLLLLDIRLPGLNGFDFLDLLPKPMPLVVVTTAYREYALKGYEHAVVDFLEKPIFFDRFSQAIQRAEERFRHSRQEPETSYLVEKDKVKSDQKVLSVRVDRNQVNIPLDNISYIESLDNYVKIYQLKQRTKPLLTKITMSMLESKLPEQLFVRINRKYIVRIDQIHIANSVSIQLFTGEELPIGVTFRDAVRQALNSTI